MFVFNLLDDLRYLVIDVASLPHLGRYLLGGIHNRGVIAIPEVGTDFW